MAIATGQNANPSDFINFSEINAIPASDVGRVAKHEADGRTHPFFTRNGTVFVSGETINGTTTPVPVFQNKSDNEVYACDANDPTKYKYIGFAISNATDGNIIAVQGSGVVAGFTGLQEGEKYYVQDTAGTIGTSPGTQEILVGVAVSETEILIQKGKYRAAGSGGSLGTASGSLAVTCGFRPSVVRVKASIAMANGGEASYLDFAWVNGVISGIATYHDSASPLAENSARLYYNTTSIYMTFTITSVTDTGFTITWTETGTFNPAGSVFMWEAEGEL